MLVVIKLTLESIVADAPDNFVIRDALTKCFEVLQGHQHIVCSCSGGSDSDVMVDMLLRCGAKNKTDFVFFNTGLEYAATFEHLKEIEKKYGITIQHVTAIKPIPICAKEYGIPFWSKFASDMIHRLQSHNFQWEDKTYDELIQAYPRCKTALEWWCNVITGNTTQYAIKRIPYLKEFMVVNPPAFRISDKCCTYAKKKVAERFIKTGTYDLSCIGVRQSEGGIRAATYKTCFSDGDGVDYFRPVFWLRDADKTEYCRHYGVVHSKCYTQYSLARTGCFGCPFGKRFEDELQSIEQFEPKLLLAANNIFGESYEYTRRYLAFREYMKREMKIHRT